MSTLLMAAAGIWEARAIAAEAKVRELTRRVEWRDRRIARLVSALDYARAQGVVFPGDADPRMVQSPSPDLIEE